MLSHFGGVLVSDFYAGYDSINCAQQKCLVHLLRDINELAVEVFGGDYPEFAEYEHQTKVLKKAYDKMRVKPNKTWYPRFLKIEDRIDVLKEIKGHRVGNAILERLIARYDHIVGLKDYAKNRYRFIVGRGWWNKVDFGEDEG